MSNELQNAMIAMLFDEMARHIDNGMDFHDAMIAAFREIRRQTRGSRVELVERLILHAEENILYAREYGMRTH
jgi:hypothetical protein